MISDIPMEETKPVKSIEDIKKAKRLFYEVGFYAFGSWIKTGSFKEINDIQNILNNDNKLSDSNYIKHHNFRYI